MARVDGTDPVSVGTHEDIVRVRATIAAMRPPASCDGALQLAHRQLSCALPAFGRDRDKVFS